MTTFLLRLIVSLAFASLGCDVAVVPPADQSGPIGTTSPAIDSSTPERNGHSRDATVMRLPDEEEEQTMQLVGNTSSSSSSSSSPSSSSLPSASDGQHTARSSSSSSSSPRTDLEPQTTDRPRDSPPQLIDGLTVQERSYRVSMLRQHLMTKLGLTDLQLSPASTAMSMRSLPPAIRKKLWEKEIPQQDVPMYKEPESEITEVLSYAQNVTDCPGPGSCFRFDTVPNIIGKPIKSVVLWMFMSLAADDDNRSNDRRLTIWLLRSGTQPDGLRKQLATKIVRKKEGWFQLELQADKYDTHVMKHRLQITNAPRTSSEEATAFNSDSADDDGSTDPPISTDHDKLPIMVVTVDVGHKDGGRARRQSTGNCLADSESCCLHNFRVNLTEVLGGIVVSPKTIFANFCQGGCMQTSNFASTHAQVMRNQAAGETDADLRQEMEPCCVPYQYNPPSSIVIRRSDNTISNSLVNDISAYSCSCK